MAYSIGDVQDKLREVILHYTKNQLFLPMIHNVDYIYAFSGLSAIAPLTTLPAI